MKPIRLALLISGGGTTMAAILQACKQGGQLHGLIEPVLVVASKPDIGGIEKAKAHDIKEDDIVVTRLRDYKAEANPQQAFGERLLREFQDRDVQLFGQYGWLCLTPQCVIDAYEGFNQHPGPLDPDHEDFGGAGMYGLRVHWARLHYVRHTQRENQSWTEATVHKVTPEYDKGEVVGFQRVNISDNDDVVSLQEKVLPFEHRLQIHTLDRYAAGTLTTIQRSERLVLPEETELLHDAKRVARLMWPKG